jgi:hypothetical protein
VVKWISERRIQATWREPDLLPHTYQTHCHHRTHLSDTLSPPHTLIRHTVTTAHTYQTHCHHRTHLSDTLSPPHTLIRHTVTNAHTYQTHCHHRTHLSDTQSPPHNKQHSSIRIPSGLIGPSVDCYTPLIKLLYSRPVELVAGLWLWSPAPREEVAPTEHYCTKFYPLKYWFHVEDVYIQCTTLFSVPCYPVHHAVQCTMLSSAPRCSVYHAIYCTTLFSAPC